MHCHQLCANEIATIDVFLASNKKSIFFPEENS